MVAYDVYKYYCSDETIVPYHDWRHRYCKLWFDYRGEKDLFPESPMILYEGGQYKINQDITLHLELKVEQFVPNTLKCIIFHHVPTEIIFLPGLMSWRLY